MSEIRMKGLAGIDMADIPEGGGVPAAEDFVSIGVTYRDEATLTEDDPAETEHYSNENDDPEESEIVSGKRTLKVALIDYSPAALQRFMGGEVTGEIGAEAWEAPAQKSKIEKAFRVRSKNGQYIIFPRVSFYGKLDYKLAPSGIAKVLVSGNIMKPEGAESIVKGILAPTNPVITSPSVFTRLEGTPVVINLTADRPCTFEKLNGADAALIVIANNQLTMTITPDYDEAGDDNQDNIYEVTVIAVDDATGLSTTQNILIVITNEIDSVKENALFYWEAGNYLNNELVNLNGGLNIQIIEKDWPTSSIPVSSVSRLKSPFDGHFLQADDQDNLWFSALYPKEVSIAELIRSNFTRTYVKYSATEPAYIEALGIFPYSYQPTAEDKIQLSELFKLDTWYWGVEIPGEDKFNRRTDALNTFLRSAEISMDGLAVTLKFNKTISDFGTHINNIVIKVNGVQIVNKIDFAWSPYIIYNNAGGVIARKGDDISITINEGGLVGDDNVGIDEVIDHPIFNCIPDDLQIYSSSQGSQNYPHGSCVVGNRIFLGGRVSPTTITRFNNIDDLSDFDQVNIPGFFSAESLTFDEVNNKIYFMPIPIESDGHTHIFSIDPDTLEFENVLSFNEAEAVGSDALANDNEYLYTIIQGSACYLIKIRIADWLLVSATPLTDLGVGHNLIAHRYNNRTELYSIGNSRLTDFYGYDGCFIKINATNMSYVYVNVPVGYLTDDIAFKYVNEAGGLVYFVDELTQFLSLVINTETLEHVKQPGIPAFGTWIEDNNLIQTGSNGVLINYPNMDLSSIPIVRKLPEQYYGMTKPQINEYFNLSNRSFITTWSGPSYVLEIGVDQIDNALLTENKQSYMTSEENEGVYLKMED